MRTAVIVLILISKSAAAAGIEEDSDAAIARGVALRRRGDDTHALEEFRRAYAITPSPRAAAQVGLALQALGRWTDAEQRLTEALRNEQDAWIVKNHVALEAARKVIEEHLGHIEVLGGPPGAEVFVEQRSIGFLPLSGPVRATAGTVVLQVRSPGFLTVTRNVSISPGNLSRETVQLSPDPAYLARKESGVVLGQPTIATRERESQTSPGQPQSAASRTPAAWVVGTSAVVLGIGGTLALAIRSDKGNQLDRRLVVDRTCTRVGNDFFGPENRTCADLASAKDTWTWIAAGALAAAGAAAVTTGILLATRDNGDGSRRRAGIDGVHLIASIADGKPYFEARWRF